MFWRKKPKDPPRLSEPPKLPPSSVPQPSAEFRSELRAELEAVAGGADDIVTAGISMINAGAKELIRGWIRAFGQADVFVVTAEVQPGVAFYMAHESQDYIVVFTRMDLAHVCMREFPKLKLAIKTSGLEVLKMAQSSQKGIWVNVLHPACSAHFEPSAIGRLLAEAQLR